MFQSRTALITFLLVIPLVAGIGYYLLERQRYVTTEDAYVEGNIALISPLVTGIVSQIAFKENQLVKKNDILLSIDDRDYRLKVTQAQANVNSEVEIIKQLRNMTMQEQQSPSVEKMQNNKKNESIQPTAIVNQKPPSFDIDISEHEARLGNFRTELTEAKNLLEQTKIRAPFNGIVSNSHVQPGQLVRPGITLAYIVEKNNIWIKANFKETKLQSIRQGLPVTIKVDAFPNLEFTGKVDSIAPATGSEFSILPEENATGNFTKILRRVPVKITFDPTEKLRFLKPGLSVTVKIHLE
jgi:membrane fusion protein (multidrug efflux system)